MADLLLHARFEIHDGKLARFRHAAKRCLECVREHDTGTLEYDWYLSEDETRCIVLERYRESEAVLEHIANMGALFDDLLATADMSLEIFGEPSPQLREAASAFPLQVFSFVQGGAAS